MEDRIRVLTDPDHLAQDLQNIIEKAHVLSVSQAEAYEHGESLIEGKEQEEWLRVASENPEAFIQTLPHVIDALLRAIAALMALNNRRLLNLVLDARA